MYMYIHVIKYNVHVHVLVYTCNKIHALVKPLPHRWSGGLLVFCLSVYEQNFWTTNNIGTSIKLPKEAKLRKPLLQLY